MLTLPGREASDLPKPFPIRPNQSATAQRFSDAKFAKEIGIEPTLRSSDCETQKRKKTA
jgi:hypothetical protein